jgi:hypothetical protein
MDIFMKHIILSTLIIIALGTACGSGGGSNAPKNAPGGGSQPAGPASQPN